MADSTESTAHPVKKLKQLIIESEENRLSYIKKLKGNIPSRAKKDYKEMRSDYLEEPDADSFWEELSLEPTPAESSHDTSLREREYKKTRKQRIIKREENRFPHIKQRKENIPSQAKKDYKKMMSDYCEVPDPDSFWEKLPSEPIPVESSHDAPFREREDLTTLKQRNIECAENIFSHSKKQLKGNIPPRAKKDYEGMRSGYWEEPDADSFWEELSLEPTPVESSHYTSLRLRHSIIEGEEIRFSHMKQRKENIPSRAKKDYKEMISDYWNDPDAVSFWEELSLEPIHVEPSHDASLRLRDQEEQRRAQEVIRFQKNIFQKEMMMIQDAAEEQVEIIQNAVEEMERFSPTDYKEMSRVQEKVHEVMERAKNETKNMVSRVFQQRDWVHDLILEETTKVKEKALERVCVMKRASEQMKNMKEEAQGMIRVKDRLWYEMNWFLVEVMRFHERLEREITWVHHQIRWEMMRVWEMIQKEMMGVQKTAHKEIKNAQERAKGEIITAQETAQEKRVQERIQEKFRFVMKIHKELKLFHEKITEEMKIQKRIQEEKSAKDYLDCEDVSTFIGLHEQPSSSQDKGRCYYEGNQTFMRTYLQALWLQWLKEMFPILHSSACFLPAVSCYFVPAEGIDFRYDEAMQRVLFCLKRWSIESGEVIFCLSQFHFGQYVGKSCYAAAAAQTPESAGLPPEPPRDWKDGDMDFLLIHPRHGLVICEVKAFGDTHSKLNMTQEEVDDKIKTKLTLAVSQLDRAENILTQLVADIAPGLRITKTIAFPNLAAHQVKQVIIGNPRLIKDLCKCLGTTDPDDVTGLCLWSDQLSDPKTPCDVSENVFMELGKWWQRRVGPYQADLQKDLDIYRALLARICGPAATVTVPGNLWSENLDQIILSPKQIDLLNTAPPRVFLVDRVTGKTSNMTLVLMAVQWLRRGNDVMVVPPLFSDDLYHLLQQTVSTQPELLGKVHKHRKYNFFDVDTLKEAVKMVSNTAKEGQLFIIACTDHCKDRFSIFCEKLLTAVPRLHLWASSSCAQCIPRGWKREDLSTYRFFLPFISPPSHREKPRASGETVPSVDQKSPSASREQVEQVAETTGPPDIKTLSQRILPKPVRAPVRQVHGLHHECQRHRERFIEDCVICGSEVARVLHSLGVGEWSVITSASPYLQYKDVVILSRWYDVGEDSGVVKGLKGKGIPVKVMKEDSSDDVATTSSDVVWLTHRNYSHDLEKKVIVYLNQDFLSPHYVPLCTSHLVVVTSTLLPTQDSNLGAGTRRSTCQDEDKKGTKHGQQQEKNENKNLAAEYSAEKANDKDRRMCHSFADECGRYSVSYEIRINLADAATLKASRSVKDYPPSDAESTESKTGETIENSGDTIPSPILSRNWDDRLCFSAEGAKLRRQGSDVILQVPPGAVQEKTNVTVYATVCGSDTYIKQKLHLSATETVVSPLAEFWAGSDFRFQKHVHVTLPTCLYSDYNVDLLHVYCVTGEGSDGQMIFGDLQRLDRLSQTADTEIPGAYFYISETGEVHVMTTHFSGYVCTYCGFCQNIGVGVYASQKHEKESIHVAILVRLWDKLPMPDFKEDYLERNLYKLVWHTTFPLEKMFRPAALQVELNVSDEQAAVWQNTVFKRVPQKMKRFPLNCNEVDCKKRPSDNHVKYTELGPFSASWMFKCQSPQTPSTLDVCLTVSHLQTEGNLEPHSSDEFFHINVQPHTEDENCRPNGHQERPCVVNNYNNINNVNGDLFIAQESITRESREESAISDNTRAEEETSLKTVLHDD